MRPLKIKDRCTKKKLKKCEEVARTYDKIQTAYADVLDKDKNIEVIKCNVLLENLEGMFYDSYKDKTKEEKISLIKRLIKGNCCGCGILRPLSKPSAEKLYKEAIQKPITKEDFEILN